MKAKTTTARVSVLDVHTRYPRPLHSRYPPRAERAACPMRCARESGNAREAGAGRLSDRPPHRQRQRAPEKATRAGMTTCERLTAMRVCSACYWSRRHRCLGYRQGEAEEHFQGRWGISRDGTKEKEKKIYITG
jgi:hypothetical protein